MDEEPGVTAPITRRRRKMSVEQSDDGKPSPVPGTPTKKRGRKPAKSDLELIDENVAEDNLKATTKKTAVKEIKDNSEEKPVTPSRRSARIKSNTSIVSDTLQAFDSPRAKRAARRNSQVGSDNEIPLTPVRQTRRTRRDSTSSIEKQDAVTTDLKTTTKIPEAILEEPENSNKVTKLELKSSDSESSKQSPIRRSPRLLNKNPASNNSSVSDVKSSELDGNNANTSQSKIEDPKEQNVSTKVDSENTNDSFEAPNINTAVKSTEREGLSTSSENLIRDLDMDPPKHLTYGNKSLSEAQETNKTKQKRHRTKSWTTITAPSLTSDDFYSDNEKTKKKRQSTCYVVLENVNNSGSGDFKLNSSKCDDKRKDLDISKKGNSMNKSSILNNETSLDHTSDKVGSNDEKTEHDGEIRNLFKSDPSNNIQAVVIMEDSDTDCKRINKQKNDVNEDQCVPVVDHNLGEEKNDSPDYVLSTPYGNQKDDSIFKQSKSLELKTASNDSCEPMDVDETLPEILTNNVSNNELESKQKSVAHESSTNKSLRKTPRKSSISLSRCEDLDKSGNENKTTLVLSELKDSVSENKSPKMSNHKLLSKSVNTSNVTETTSEINKRLSQNYLTSTPLQNKNLGKQDEQISKMFDDDISKTKRKVSPKKNMSAITNSQSSEADSSADEESVTSDKENLLDDEAEEASDSYLSGDSRDEEEKQYEKENEIVEKGETLTSEDELSNDSNYEKDSFLVSSNEEDNDLLSGSGDDLSMSDNELKMNSLSKKKYNERKIKEQKRASREMFESRHKLNDSNKSLKLKQRSFQISDSSQSEDDVIRPKNNKRNRLISINESANKSDSQHSNSTENNEDMKSPENSFKNALTEKEITLCDETSNEIHDPLATQIKKEPKTPGKDISVGFVDTNNVKDTTSQNTSNSKAKNPLEDSDDDSSSLSSEDMNIAKNYDNVLKELKSKAANVSLNKDENTTSKLKQNISGLVDLNTETKESTKRKRKSSQNTNDVSSNLNKINDESGNISNSNLKPDVQGNVASNAETVIQTIFGNSSLNLSKKSKKNKQLIIDQLNLTQVKDKSTKTTKSKSKSTKKKIESLNSDDSSDSIDLKLLFSEDSGNSVDQNKTSGDKAGDDCEPFIPLKKSRAKTNIRANEDDAENKEEEMIFFEDTIGDRSMREENIEEPRQKSGSSGGDSNDDEPPVEISYKKRNSLVTNIKDTNKDHSSELSQSENALMNASNVESKKKTKKIRSSSLNQSNLIETETEQAEENFIELLSKTPKSEKKKKKDSVSESLIKSNLTEDQPTAAEDPINQTLISKTPKSERKKNKKLSESQAIAAEDAINNSLTSKTPKSEKKKKNLSDSLHKSINSGLDDDEANNKSVTLQTPKSLKKNKSDLSQSIDKSHRQEPDAVDTAAINTSTSQTPSAKKKKNMLESSNNSVISQTEDVIESEESNIQSETITNVSSEKKKKKQFKSLRSVEDSKEEDTAVDQLTNNDRTTKKKRLSSRLETENEAPTAAENEPKREAMITNEEDKSNEGGKQRKRKHSGPPALEGSSEGAVNESVLRQSKKLRVSQNEQETANKVTEVTEEPGSSKVVQNISISSKKKNKKNKSQDDEHSHDIIDSTKVTKSQSKHENSQEIQFTGGNENKENGDENKEDVRKENQAVSVNAKAKSSKSKKRKNREDDEGRHKDAKVLKENSLDQIHIPRLPPSVLNELVDKPKKRGSVKKQMAISTTKFEVLETTKARTKPSNYLEESIYIKDIDDGYAARKKQKAIIKKPRVLPFVPTAAISNSGFTTNFKVNVIPQEIKFVAQSTNVPNFKNDYLYRQKINRNSQSTSYKRNRNIKMSKF